MSSVVIAGDTSGSVTLQAPATAGSVVVTLPSASGTMVVGGTTPTLSTLDVTGNANLATSSGSVGIGTASPVDKLDVRGGAIRLGDDNVVVWGSSGYNNYISGNSSTNSVKILTNGSERMRIDSSGNVGIGSSSVVGDLEIRRDTTTAADCPQLTFTNFTSGASSYYAGGMFGVAYRDITNPAYIAGVEFGRDSAAGGAASSGSIRFYTDGAGTSLSGIRALERMRIDSAGNLLVGTTTAQGAGGITMYKNGSGTSGLIVVSKTADGVVNTAMGFVAGGSTVGNITYNNTSTSYVTSSDYRLKENVAPMTGALSVVQQLKPVTYNWKVDGSAGQGFIAHELQSVVPDCVTGEKDAVETIDEFDAEGKLIGTKEVPKYQGIDTSFLVATLTAAIQELNAKVTALEAQLGAK